MRRFIVVIMLVFLSLGAWAQYAVTGAIRRVGTHIEMNGERLSHEAQAALLADIGGNDYNPEWERARKGRRTGVGLVVGGGTATILGGGVLVLGATTSVIGAAIGGTVGSIGGQEGAQKGAEEGASAGGPLITAGLITTGLGIVATVVGIPLITSNNKALNGIVNAYNKGGQSSAHLSFGTTGSGVGLALVF